MPQNPEKTPKSTTVAKTRLRIIDAAREVFAEQGIEGATTRGIAEKAGCNEVTLFRHFESKQKLLVAVVEDTTDEFRSLCDSPSNLTGNLHDDLRKYAEVYNHSVERCEGMCRALIGESRRRPTLARELIGDVLQPFHKSLAAYFQAQMEQGKVRQDCNPEAVAEMLTASIMGALLRRTSGLSMLSQKEWLDQIVDAIARSLKT